MIVIDASLFLTGILPDEDDPLASRLLSDVASSQQQAIVPSLFYAEVVNAGVIAVRRKRIAPSYIDTLISSVLNFPVEVDRADAFYRQGELALKHNLTFYDATYLELAERLECKLATLDKALNKAAKAIGVDFKK